MVVAKTDAALSRLTIEFQNREVEKRYRALVLGRVASNRGWIAAPIGRNPDDRPRWWVRPEGRPAETRYRVERRLPGFTLLELEPLTGRTNQLRIHCAWIGHPIAGDTEYGGVSSRTGHLAASAPGRVSEYGPAATEPVSAVPLSTPPSPDRLFLHASHLAFRHPVTREWIAFDSELPAALAQYLRDVDG
jgi:23S rRNA pseudouridine1911/1915/1917 synthase